MKSRATSGRRGERLGHRRKPSLRGQCPGGNFAGALGKIYAVSRFLSPLVSPRSDRGSSGFPGHTQGGFDRPRTRGALRPAQRLAPFWRASLRNDCFVIRSASRLRRASTGWMGNFRAPSGRRPPALPDGARGAILAAYSRRRWRRGEGGASGSRSCGTRIPAAAHARRFLARVPSRSSSAFSRMLCT
jgi:hypothetical protein